MSKLIKNAKKFAYDAHSNQKYGDKPYSYHLDGVAKIVASTVPVDEAIAVAYLHDVVEDTDASLELLREEFGDVIADAVELLTDAPGTNRKERKAKTYARLGLSENKLAKIVKIADRLHNVSSSVLEGRFSLLEMYKKEHHSFRSAAYGHAPELEKKLDTLLEWK